MTADREKTIADGWYSHIKFQLFQITVGLLLNPGSVLPRSIPKLKQCQNILSLSRLSSVMHGEIKQYWHLLWVFSAAARKFSLGTRRVPKWCIFVHLVRSYRAAMFVLHCNTFKSHPVFAPGSRAAKNKLWTSVLASNIFEVTVLKIYVWNKVCRHESLVWLVYGKYEKWVMKLRFSHQVVTTWFGCCGVPSSRSS